MNRNAFDQISVLFEHFVHNHSVEHNYYIYTIAFVIMEMMILSNNATNIGSFEHHAVKVMLRMSIDF